jgi:Ca-activated chloride channel family protein
MYITFAHPRYLLLLLIIPLFFLIHLLTLKNTKNRALRFANFEAISRIKGVDFFSKNITVFLLSVFVIFFLVISVSGLTLHRQIEASSFSFILAIDSSRSMEAKDMQPNRLEVAKETAKSFVDSTPASTKIGVVSFSGSTYIHTGLTEDKDEIKEAIDKIERSFIEGTDIYEVVITSTNLLENEEARAVILLSDGQMNVGEIDYAIEYANKNDVIVHTIAVGTEEGGETSYGISKLDEDSLKALAYNTEGEFSKAQDEDSLINSFSSKLELTNKKISTDLSFYFVLTSIFLFVLVYVLVNSRNKLLP